MRNALVVTGLAAAVVGAAAAWLVLGTRVSYDHDLHVDLFVYRDATKGCTFATLPSYAQVKKNKEIFWHVRPAGGDCAGEVADFTIAFGQAGYMGGLVTDNPNDKKTKHANARRETTGNNPKYITYTVTLTRSNGTEIKEDPQIEIW